MNALHPTSIASSEMSDLDGYSLPGDYSFNMHSQYPSGNEDFGFDPPQNSLYLKNESFSPSTLPDPLQLSGWSGFDVREGKDSAKPHHEMAETPNHLQNLEMNGMLGLSIPNPATAVQRFGQVTPPRSNSASSEDKPAHDVASSKANTERRRRTSKAVVKDESDTAQPTSTRKRKNTRKGSTAKEEQDDKRRQSLEKNRLAAAKCRINKKEKTEILQRNSHEKAVHNAFLKEQVMRMKEEVQQMNALLLAHANCDGCKSPEEIQKHLSNLGNEFFSHQMPSMSYEYPVNLDEMSHMAHDSAMQTDYFGPESGNRPLLNPPLPDFDRTAEFDVHTPMHTD